MKFVLSARNLSKKYGTLNVLNSVDIKVAEKEIVAIVGPSGAGKTTLISNICGISSITSGDIKVNGFDVVDNYREARKCIGIVPQELSFEPFEKVINTVNFSRGLFGLKPDDKYIKNVIQSLKLWDKKNS